MPRKESQSLAEALEKLDRLLRRYPRFYRWLEKPLPRWVVWVSPIHWVFWLWTGKRP